MPQTVKYELLVRFNDAGENPVALGRTRTIYESGHSVENRPEQIAIDSAEWSDWTDSLSVAAIAERDAAIADRNAAIAERDAAVAVVDAKNARIAELEALLNPPSNPRHVPPFNFLKLLTPNEIYAIQTTTDPPAVIARAKLQTIITYVDLDDPELVAAVNYFEQAGIIAEGRGQQILAGEPRT